MGVGQSTEDGARASSPEALSYLLAERFATKCFTPLELTHLKDNFFSRAIDQSGLKHWNEKILSDFLGIPDGSDTPGTAAASCPLDAGPVVFRMVSYLGAFPFQNTLAPSVLTFDAMVKVVVLLTERYGKVLRRGHRDRVKLLFGSLADVGRRESLQPAGKQDSTQTADDAAPTALESASAAGFAIDQPTNDDDYEDEGDDLALAALESLDAIEVFKHDQRIDKAVYEARISHNTFRRLLMLLLVIAPLKPLQPVSNYTGDLNADRMDRIRREAESILASFGDEDNVNGISYGTFARTISSSLPFLFDPLTPLFEHMLFSRNLNLSQKRNEADSARLAVPETDEEQSRDAASSIDPIMLTGSFESAILHDSVLAHISFFLPTSPSVPNLFRSKVRLHPVFSTAAHGSSLTSFSHHVMTWQSSTLLIVHGARDAQSASQDDEDTSVVLGAYLPSPWKSSSPTSSSSVSPEDSNISCLPCLFQLSPKHMLLPGNPSTSSHKPNTPAAHFSTHTGLAVGCEIPPSSRSTHPGPRPHGAGSLIIDTSLDSAEFHVTSNRHDGVFLPPAGPAKSATAFDQLTKTKIDIYTLEVWGLVEHEDHDDPASALTSPATAAAAAATPSYVPRAVALQREKWNFEAREAERRKNVNLNVGGGGESAVANARWLLETAGLIGENSGNGRAGGSV